jgi:predicted transcriptional regulator
MQSRMLVRMHTTSVRIDVETHRELKRIASELDLSVGQTVRYAVQRLEQSRIGEQLHTEPSVEESQWLDADLG